MTEYYLPGKHIYNGMVMCKIFPAEVLKRVHEFQFRSDDVLIATYPKAGTTWLQKITWMIQNNMDVKSSRTFFSKRDSCFLEKQEFEHDSVPCIDNLAEFPSPRMIKTHLPYDFFKDNIEGQDKPKFKVIIGLRNPKDVFVSYFHFNKMNAELGNFPGDFNDFFDLFKQRKLVHGDYFDHVLSWWKERSNPNILFVKYEDLKANPTEEITRIASFLGKNLNPSQLDIIIKETSFTSMKDCHFKHGSDNPLYDLSVSPFIRTGKVGDWQNYLTAEQIIYMDDRSSQELAQAGLFFQDH